MRHYRTRFSTISWIFLHVLLGTAVARAQVGATSPDRLWRLVDEPQERPPAAADEALAVGEGRFAKPAVFRTVELTEPETFMGILAEARELRSAEEERTGEVPPLEISLPMPDGTFARFTLTEDPILAPELAERFRELKAYRGRGIDDPSASLRLTTSSTHIHAQILTDAETVWIDPTAEEGRYVSYGKGDNRHQVTPIRCRTASSLEERDLNEAPAANGAPRPMRRFRLAVAATGEYTRHFGGRAQAMDAIHRTIARVSGIYERELAIRFELVARNDRLIFTDPGTDHLTNDKLPILIQESQKTIDDIIGGQAYDIGHTFGTLGGGLAAEGACNPDAKAMGVTGTASPFGDAFDVDFVAHEIGHQLGATHTFNSVQGFCAGNRTRATAFEPGSGSTIMAYAGICGRDDCLQKNSDDYFHAASLAQIQAFLRSQDGCATQIPTSNRVPTVEAGVERHIPVSTPFELTAQGSDPDGDPVLIAWEEMDLGPPASLAAPDDGRGPLFRSFRPTLQRTRTFPALETILNGGSSPGEKMPTVQRNLRFRVTARDLRPDGGGTAFDEVLVHVHDNGGPFVVEPTSGPVHTMTTVRWRTGGSERAPIAAPTVDVLLSVDGGHTFPYRLAAGLPNNGVALVTLPSLTSHAARFRIQPAGRAFFSVSPEDFEIVPPERALVLVRHADRPPGEDPPLLPEGRARALRLGKLLAPHPPAAIYTTRTQRTRETAEIVASVTGAPVMQPAYQDAADLETALAALDPGQWILAIGHSDTIPEIVSYFKGPEGLSIRHDEYDRVFLLTYTSGALSFEQHRY